MTYCSIAVSTVFRSNETLFVTDTILFAAEKIFSGADEVLSAAHQVLFAADTILSVAPKVLSAVNECLSFTDEVLFAANKTVSTANEVLSAAGEQEIDQVIGTAKDSVIGQQIIVEGYSNEASVADQMAASRSRSLIVAHYLEKRFHLSAKNIGLMPLNAAAPPSSGKDSWDGACIVLLVGTAGTMMHSER